MAVLSIDRSMSATSAPTPATKRFGTGRHRHHAGARTGSQSESKQGQTVTVALTSDVLFALDKYTLTAKAKQRLRTVAEKITAEWAGGPIRINGHTDDQGADDYNLQLSLRRARAVQQALQEALSGQPVTFEAKGYGEAKPKLPDIIDAKPIDANRARNRRVEIVFSVKE